MKYLILLIGLLLIFNGCSTRYGMLTIATTKNVNINMQEFEKVADGVTGNSTKHIIIIIPTGNPTIEDALEDALKKTKGDLMQNVVIYYKWWYIPYVFGEFKFEIKGDVYRVKQKSTGLLDESKLQEAYKVFDLQVKANTLNLVEVDSITDIQYLPN